MLHPEFGNVNFRKTIWKEIKITQKGVLRKMSRLDYQPLFEKGARAPPPNSRLDA